MVIIVNRITREIVAGPYATRQDAKDVLAFLGNPQTLGIMLQADHKPRY